MLSRCLPARFSHCSVAPFFPSPALQPLPLPVGPTVVVEETPLTEAMAPAVTVADWQGLHFGIAAGRPTGDNFWAAPGVGAESTPGDWSGTMTSLSAGYDWQRGRLIYGLTLAVSGNGIDASPTYSETFLCEGCETTVDKLITLRGRIGLSSGKTLFFASAGAARADAIGTFSNFTAGKDSLTGWTAGIGVERFISQKTTLSAEYLHTDLGRLELPNICNSYCSTDVSFGLVQFGVNYHW